MFEDNLNRRECYSSITEIINNSETLQADKNEELIMKE